MLKETLNNLKKYLWTYSVLFFFCFLVYYDNISYNDRIIKESIGIPYNETKSNRVWGLIQPVTEEDFNCMALNIYFESRGEPIKGQYAVGDVVMYRVQHHNYPNTICDVIKDGIYAEHNIKMPLKHRCAFSWWCDRKPDRPVDGRAFELAMDITNDILTNSYYTPRIEYSIFYHASHVKPKWVKNRVLVTKIGEHYFYR